MENPPRKNACVIVLGDIGRSPRMQYHAKSFLDTNYNVDIVGYVDTLPCAEITGSPHAKIHPLTAFPDLELPNIVRYVFKTIWQTLSLLAALFSLQRPELVLCQNPPAIPTLFVCYFYTAFVRCQFIIDWHNYAHSILALDLSHQSPIVSLAKFIETRLGRKSHVNLCVTKAMRNDLKKKWNIDATVLYDRPPAKFQPIKMDKKHELFMKLGQQYSIFLQQTWKDFTESGVQELTVFTQKTIDGKITYKDRRPGLLVSSTSWTIDEDFSVLSKALEEYDDAASTCEMLPKLICVITGKGPLKEMYKSSLETVDWRHVSIVTPWLEAEDYPVLLAAADLGVCLHMSSSGLDLPMKVVDMFGSGLPVCARNFECLGELVQHEENGFVFENATELSNQLQNWFIHYNFNNATVTEKINRNLKQFQSLRWHENWTKNALPLFRK